MQNSNKKNGSPLKFLLYAAAFTVSFSSIALCLYLIREVHDAKNQNISLNETRMSLIAQLKENNKEIEKLKSKQVNDEPVQKIKNEKGSNKAIAQSTLEKSATINGIPISVTNGSKEKKYVTFTFDGGSDANIALEILDTLNSRNVKATMFVTGSFIRNFASIVKRITTDGHELGNHTYSHPNLTTYAQNHKQCTLPDISKTFIQNQLYKNDQELFELTGQHFAPIWRAPYGEFNQNICTWALECGYLHVGWKQGQSWSQSLDSNDWIAEEGQPGFRSPHEVMHKILMMADTYPYGINVGIILMHLGTNRKDKTQQVQTILGKLIDELRSKGYELVTISELLKHSQIDVSKIPTVHTVSYMSN